MDRSDLSARHCRPCEGGVQPLSPAEARELLAGLNGWLLEGNAVERRFRFSSHHEVLAFVNAIAWISQRENHHPEVRFGYDEVRVRYWTHASGGLTESDFICAAKVDQLLAG